MGIDYTDPGVVAVLQRLAAATPEQQARTYELLKVRNPEFYAKLARYVNANRGFLDEAQGYEHWLKKFGPHSFTGSFAPFHHEFFQWYFPIAIRLRQGKELNPNDLVALLPWARDTGKSTCSEWSAIMEGCLVRRGYVLWVSGKLDQAIEHIVSIRDRIESEQIGRVYPHMNKPKLGMYGNKFGWGKEFLMTGDSRTGGGWAVRPAGLNEAMRGGKVLDMRPTLIVLSDVDEIGDSIMVVEQKEQSISRSVLPMGSSNTRVIFDQNPIHANSVMNRILNRVSTVLSVRRVIDGRGGTSGQPVSAFEDDIQIEFEQTEYGPRHIIKSGTPTWSDMDISKCQVFLDRSGLAAFEAEYLHRLDATLEERVLPEFDDRKLRLHCITLSQYESLYNTRRIPTDWPKMVGLDLGYSSAHKSAWSFMAKVPEGQKLSGSVFLYRGRTFTSTSVDDQSVAVRNDLWPGEKFIRQTMSHEKLGERILLANKHQWFFQPCASEKQSGIPQWRHFLRPDRSQPHPFHRDEKGMDGLWKLGRPAFFMLVADDQLFSPRDDDGLKRHRDGAFNWRMRPVKYNESGMTVEQPMKAEDDEVDSVRQLFAGTNSFAAKHMNQAQKLQALIPESYRKSELLKRGDLTPNQKHLTSEMAEYLAKRTMKLKRPPLTDAWGQPMK